jgi:hypothetical protein
LVPAIFNMSTPRLEQVNLAWLAAFRKRYPWEYDTT